MTVVDRYVDDLCSRLHVGAHRQARIAQEVRDHLTDAIEVRLAGRAASDAAAEEAIAEFGSPALLASQFNVESGTHAVRQAPFAVVGAGLLVLAGLMIAAATQQHGTVRINAAPVVEITFFSAVVAFEIAIVAAVCGVSRIAALWRNHSVSAAERIFVQRCTTVAVAGLGAAAIGWATAIGLSYESLPHPNKSTLALGTAIMVAAAVASSTFAARLRINAADEASGEEMSATGVLALGERMIEIIREHPVAACVGATLVSATAAMAHAETTASRALPWGLANAVAVVTGFVFLGPMLQLRRPQRDA